MGELSWLLTVYELAFLLFRVKEAAQVEDDGQKEHEAGHGDDRHRLLTGDGTIEVLTPESAGHIHLQTKVPNIRQTWADRKIHWPLCPVKVFSHWNRAFRFGYAMILHLHKRGFMSMFFQVPSILGHMSGFKK